MSPITADGCQCHVSSETPIGRLRTKVFMLVKHIFMNNLQKVQHALNYYYCRYINYYYQLLETTRDAVDTIMVCLRRHYLQQLVFCCCHTSRLLSNSPESDCEGKIIEESLVNCSV